MLTIQFFMQVAGITRVLWLPKLFFFQFFLVEVQGINSVLHKRPQVKQLFHMSQIFLLLADTFWGHSQTISAEAWCTVGKIELTSVTAELPLFVV